MDNAITPIRAGGIKQLGMTSDGRYIVRGGSDHQVYSVKPVSIPSADEIKEIRKGTGLDEERFAEAIGVSVRVLKNWENGTKKPDGATSRLLDIIKEDRSVIDKFV